MQASKYNGGNSYPPASDEALLLQTEKQDSLDSDEYVEASQQRKGAVVERSYTDVMNEQPDGRQQRQQPSLAQSLRQRREFMEHIEQERAIYGGGSKVDKRDKNNLRQISQTDATGSAIRIRNQRPQTPRLNLLKLGRQQYVEGDSQHPLFSQQAQLPKSKPFNYLNPNAKIGVAKLQVIPSHLSSAAAAQASNSNVTELRALKHSPTKTSPQMQIKSSDVVFNNNRHQEESKEHQPVVSSFKTATATASDAGAVDANADFNALQQQQEQQVLAQSSPRHQQMSQSSHNTMQLTNMQDHFMEIMNNEQVEDVIDLNEKFLAMALGGIEVSELALLPKLELRVDTTCHSLQVTGEILPSLEYLKLNDSIIRCFRDVGTSFKNVRVLHIARCELKEVQGIQAFEQLEELYISHNAIEELFDVSLAEHLQVLDLEGNNIKEVDQLKYLRRMPRLADVNFRGNPVAKELAYCQKIAEVVPKLQVLDDEPIGESFELFVQEKQEESRQNSLQTEQVSTSELYSGALATVLAQFARLGLSDSDLLEESKSQPVSGVNSAQNTIELKSLPIIEKLLEEPANESLLISQLKNQNKDQKAQQSYETNMDVQGFGGTMTSGFFNQTASSGFGAGAPHSSSMTSFTRPQSAAMTHVKANRAGDAGLMTEAAAEDDEDERRAQMEFEQSMRATSMSFFKTAKSTFMSTNDLQSDHLMTESYQAWGAESSAVARGDGMRGDDDDEGSDLAANADQIITGGAMSILRRKGKQGKERRRDRDVGRTGKLTNELLSSDILSLLQIFHEEANTGTSQVMRDRSNDMDEVQQPAIRSKTTGSAMKVRPQSTKKVRPSSKLRASANTSAATSINDPRLAAVAQILERKKTGLGDSSHKPTIVGSGSGSVAFGGTGEKLAASKIKFVQGSTNAPMKSTKMMTVKLRPSQIAFKSAETKVIKKDPPQ